MNFESEKEQQNFHKLKTKVLLTILLLTFRIIDFIIIKPFIGDGPYLFNIVVIIIIIVDVIDVQRYGGGGAAAASIRSTGTCPVANNRSLSDNRFITNAAGGTGNVINTIRHACRWQWW